MPRRKTPLPDYGTTREKGKAWERSYGDRTDIPREERKLRKSKGV